MRENGQRAFLAKPKKKNHPPEKIKNAITTIAQQKTKNGRSGQEKVCENEFEGGMIVLLVSREGRMGNWGRGKTGWEGSTWNATPKYA